MFSRSSNAAAAPAPRRLTTPGDPLADLLEVDEVATAGMTSMPSAKVAPEAAVPAGVVTLSQPYDAFGEPVTSLKFRAPKAKDIAAVGKLPFKFDVSVINENAMLIDEVHTDWAVLTRYIPLLAEPAITPATVEKFTLEDLDACAMALSGFFMTPAAARIRLTPPTGSPGSTT